MDDIVKQAMVRWPSVPACYGWLGLDGRGNWYMRDAAAQQAGAFASGRPGAKGSRIEHQGLIAFIQRNYTCDVHGRWYFQNGPQRVFVELEVTPWVWRVSEQLTLSAHDGTAVTYVACLVDERGMLYLHTSRGIGLVHTQDMGWAAQAIETLGWEPQTTDAAAIAVHFGYVTSPQAGQDAQ